MFLCILGIFTAQVFPEFRYVFQLVPVPDDRLEVIRDERKLVFGNF